MHHLSRLMGLLLLPAVLAGLLQACSSGPRWQLVDMSIASRGSFSGISVGFLHGCGVLTDGTVKCWDENATGRFGAPPETFRDVSAGYDRTCGVTTADRVVCWGAGSMVVTPGPTPPGSCRGCPSVPVPPGVAEGSFTAVSVGYGHVCAVAVDGAVTCWGDNRYGQADAPSGRFASVSAGGWHACGLGTDSTVTCWGDNGDGQADAPSGEFTAMSAGFRHSCGLRVDGTVACWGENSHGQATAPAETFLAVSAGGWHSCGVRPGEVVCWGAGGEKRMDGSFTAFSAGAGWGSDWSSIKKTRAPLQDPSLAPVSQGRYTKEYARYGCGLMGAQGFMVCMDVPMWRIPGD